jgi:spore germination protein YaaH
VQFGINLLAKEKITVGAEKEAISRLKKTFVLVLLAYALVIVSLLGPFFYLSYEKGKIATEISQLEANIKSFQKVENLEVLIKSRVAKAQIIIESRAHVEKIIVKIVNSLEEGITVGNLDFGKNNQISFSAQAQDVKALETFLEKIKSILKEEGYSLAKLDSISRDKKGGYSFELVAEK